MKIHISNLKPVLFAFVEEVILPKSTPWQQFGLSFALAQGNKIDSMINKLQVFADEDMCFDIQKTKENLLNSFDKTKGSLTIPQINWVIDKDDIEKIAEIATRYSKD